MLSPWTCLYHNLTISFCLTCAILHPKPGSLPESGSYAGMVGHTDEDTLYGVWVSLMAFKHHLVPFVPAHLRYSLTITQPMISSCAFVPVFNYVQPDTVPLLLPWRISFLDPQRVISLVDFICHSITLYLVFLSFCHFLQPFTDECIAD